MTKNIGRAENLAESLDLNVFLTLKMERSLVHLVGTGRLSVVIIGGGGI
jgi:hypothetical protein